MTNNQPAPPASPEQKLDQNVEITNDLSEQPSTDNHNVRFVEQLKKIAETGNVVDIEWADLQRSLKTRLEQVIETYQERAQQQRQEQQRQQKQQEERQQQQAKDKQQQQNEDPQQQQEQAEGQRYEIPQQQEDLQKQQQEPQQRQDELEQQPQCPEEQQHLDEEPQQQQHNYNDDKFDLELSRDELLELIASFSEPPFTIQRICELLYSPFKYYDRTSTFFRGLEKNLRVVSSSLGDAIP